MKKLDFTINDVSISFTDTRQHVESPLFSNDFMKVNPCEISIDIKGIAYYFIQGGGHISITPYPGISEDTIQDQLDKWGVISILHQRKILNFHASSFSLDGKGLMICGDTGTGKSSVTAVFSSQNGGFLNDDITAIHFQDNISFIEKLGHTISLLPDTARQLGIEIKKPVPDRFKQSFIPSSDAEKLTPLSYVFHLHMIESDQPLIAEIQGTHKFSLLRSNICSWEMLEGIPGLEVEYMNQLLAISETTPVYSIGRPKNITITELADLIEQHLIE